MISSKQFELKLLFYKNQNHLLFYQKLYNSVSKPLFKFAMKK